MNSHYKLRITLTECTVKDVIKYLSTYETYAYCFEKGKQEEKPHYHIYLVTDRKEDTIRTQLRKLSKSAKGNKLYSLKQLETDEDKYAVEYLGYMLKEGEFTNVNIPEEVIIEAKAYDDQVKLEIKEKKEKKKNRYTRIVVEYEGDDDLENIFRHVCAVLLQEKTNVSQSTVTSWCNTLMMIKNERYMPHELFYKVQNTLYPTR